MIGLRIAFDPGDSRAVLARAANLRVGPPLERASRHLVRVAQPYPAPPPGSTYRRTGALKQGWQPIGPITTATQGYGGAVNEVEHAEFVMGDRQAVVHQGRWRTDEQIRDAEEGAVADIIEAGVDRQIGAN